MSGSEESVEDQYIHQEESYHHQCEAKTRDMYAQLESQRNQPRQGPSERN